MLGMIRNHLKIIISLYKSMVPPHLECHVEFQLPYLGYRRAGGKLQKIATKNDQEFKYFPVRKGKNTLYSLA